MTILARRHPGSSICTMSNWSHNAANDGKIIVASWRLMEVDDN